MLSWWTNIESVTSLSNWMLAATMVSAIIAGIMVFLTNTQSRRRVERLTAELETSRKQIKSIEKAAAAIRKELLQTLQHQDISQLKLQTSKLSAQELRQALLAAKRRLEIAESAMLEHEKRAAPEPNANPIGDDEVETGTLDPNDLELETMGGLSDSQRGQLIDLLDPGPKGSVDIFCLLGDDNAEMTATQLEAILAADGWKTSGVAKSAFSNPPEGLLLAVNSKETAPSYASFLQRVFSTIGLTVSAKMDPKYREWSLTVIVGVIDDRTGRGD